MNKKVLSRYLIDKKEIIRNLDVFPRTIDIVKTKNFIVPVVGPRRAGKSYCLYDLIVNKLKIKDADFLFMNFEDAELADINFKEIANIVNLHEEIYGKKPEYTFLDEVQNVQNWHKAVRSLFETKKYYIFISGSSSKLLSKEIVTSLRGRTLSHTILPLSFKEFLGFKKFELKPFYSSTEENKIKNSLRNYLKFGGFPDIVFENQIADKFFREYIDLVIFKDIVERYKIKNVFIIKFLIKNILASFSKEFSVHKIFNALKSQNIKVSKKTLYNYTSYLEDAFFVFFLRKISFSVRDSELSISKCYVNDTGLINSLSINFSQNIGKLMENAVFLELERRKKAMTNIFYWKNSTGNEVDFVVKQGLRIKQLIQVCYSVEDYETKEREIKALLKASKELKCKNLLVITEDYEDEEKVKGKKIKYIPLWKWLLG
ncbi:MAG: ATP-binding protein [Candidatus Thermoplasmatota archaeon]|nr:ATP-binding protein [Candidatus Thermoplasmatota archaeon]